MRLSSIFTTTAIFAGAGAVSLLAATLSVGVIESASKSDVLNELDAEGLTWAEVDTNGLQVFLIGTAPDEAARFQALSTAGRVVDAARVIDQMLVEEPEELKAPHFSIEILRNDAGISVIGLVPVETDRAALVEQFREIAGEGEVSDLLESADFPTPNGWDDALLYAIRALKDLPRSKISVDAEHVAIKAMTESEQVRVRLETALNRRKPEDLALQLDISAPRPVISPFTLRFVIDDEGARFDACSAESEEGRDRIVAAATKAGMTERAACTLGLGTPSRRWADAAALAIGKLAELGGGSVTFTNADIVLIGPEGTEQALFDRVVGEMEAGLPGVFALEASLPKTPDQADQGPPEFVATLSPEGQVQLRGRLSSDIARQTVDSFAKARFGSEAVYTAARVAEGLPQDWPVRTLAALEVLSGLVNGSVTVLPDSITVTGRTGNAEASTQIAALLTSKLGEGASYDIRVDYEERLDPTLGIPTPEECEARITEVIGARKITFEPGSATLDASAKDIMDELAELLKTCGDIPIEVGGHTDSQGREVMNEELSRERAQAVLDALRTRRVPTRDYSVKGYGETRPIADNGTEEGREANRRIEFKLLKVEDPAAEDPQAETPAEDAPAETAEDAADNNDGAEAAPDGN
ncbi:OmpA family protein [Tropicibacter alexandrii]|uniref:OmpA family protein n=1 Tax=Tropicibacter alexandrii TaxID=2267683 RepID=UPI000EF43E14|nr:OmpA family protein [Tropicibacter alexandrii]